MGHQEIVQELASHKTNINARREMGMTPIEIAEYNSRRWTTASSSVRQGMSSIAVLAYAECVPILRQYEAE